MCPGAFTVHSPRVTNSWPILQTFCQTSQLMHTCVYSLLMLQSCLDIRVRTKSPKICTARDASYNHSFTISNIYDVQSFVGETPCHHIVTDFCQGTHLMTKLTNRAYITIWSQCCWRRLHQTLSNIQPGTACEAEGDRPAGRLAALLGLLDNCACKPARPLLSCAAASLLSRSCNE